MKRALLVALMIAAAPACLPTRNRVAFGKSGSNSNNTTADTGTNTGDAGNGGDGGSGASDTGSDTSVQPPVDMGTTSMDMSTNIPDGCVPQTDQDLCTAKGAECGQLTATNNCGVQRMVYCGVCSSTGAACASNKCVESNCKDNMDNDQNGKTDCDDPGCLGRSCAPNPNKTCQADGSCA